MGYANLSECIRDLEQSGRLVRISDRIDPRLEAALIQRLVFERGGPALFFENIKGSPFPAVSNLFGTKERTLFLFRDSLEKVKKLVLLRANPPGAIKSPSLLAGATRAALHALPRRTRNAPVMKHTTSLSKLPGTLSWPRDGGPFVTLPLVYSEDPARPGVMGSNLGMYRVQLGGNRYRPEKEVGLHYQIHRGIGVHHARALERGEDLRVSIFVGGPPALIFSAVMPLPEGLPEVAFAGALGNRRFRFRRDENGHTLAADADFCIVGRISKKTLPEGPFGDHLGYYSLKHDFPVLEVEKVYHRPGAIWPFTSVGRPPQEDTMFGELIHEIAAPMAGASVPGLHALHAVDAAGVHPLLLAQGSERYVPYAERRPQELLTIANALLGFGQASLAKYLFIIAREDNPELDIHDIAAFFRHLLERLDPARDLHFQTRVTMDTLDYTGYGFNEGSKVVFAAAGKKIRALSRKIPGTLRLPPGFRDPGVALPGAMTLSAPDYGDEKKAERDIRRLLTNLSGQKKSLQGFPLIVLTEDSEFAARTLNNFLWVTFTRSDPARDVRGAGESIHNKHWSCEGPIVIDARRKPFHAPPLEDDPKVLRRVQELGAAGGSLHGIL